ncbi:class I SAM-dependent methyltransferase [Sphingomonas solaris]|uniref:Methyltransferase domain-containing protein n=1 Tax=Alterirhizorhabdus solaris TaxID=2529389 RepID=A0A558QZX6_9SPHN|nr:methyltransferase domain-containing protein [Sphingomonas solaris]TVV72694.1 methyltransferase domain-containing protein [Sphingomonas solaris]
MRARVAGLALMLLASCGPAATRRAAEPKPSRFPAAHRPVAPIVSSRFSTEEARDRIREADTVMNRADIAKGMTVADIGAGEGYYTVRLAQRVGKNGRVLAQDIVPAVRDTLAERVTREALDNVSVKLGLPADPKLPAASFDRILMVHMYHEIAAPYEFLWRLRPALRPGGRVVVVDADRPTSQHGTPPDLLDCEMKSVGYTRVGRTELAGADAYLALYEAVGPRPEPEAISSCTLMTPA